MKEAESNLMGMFHEGKGAVARVDECSRRCDFERADTERCGCRESSWRVDQRHYFDQVLERVGPCCEQVGGLREYVVCGETGR